MEREDFRNGGGPNTAFIHCDPHVYALYGVPKDYERMYKYMMRPRVEYHETARKALKRSNRMCDALQEDLDVAASILRRIAFCGNFQAAAEAMSALTAMGYIDDIGIEQDYIE